MDDGKKKVTLALFDTVSACNQAAKIELRHPVTREGVGMFIYVVGRDSDVLRQRNNDINDANRTRAFMFAKQGKPIEPRTREEEEEEQLTTLALCTTGYEGVLNKDGTERKFSHRDACELYRDHPVIRDQIDNAIMQYANFIKD
jgi:hypothetical protein